MVDFNQTDFKVVLVMVLFLVIISFIFPPMGFTSENVKATDIPKFNASQNQFSGLGDPPELPNNPSQGKLRYEHGAAVNEDNRQMWLQGDSDNGYSTTLVNLNTQSNPDMQVTLNRFNTSGSFSNSATITENQYVELEIGEYTVGYENLEFSENNETVTVDWKVVDQPDDQGWIDRIPVVGGIVSGAKQLASILGWIGSLIFYAIAQAVITASNIFIAIFNLITFILSFFYWLLSTYATVTSNAPTDWASVFMAIPGAVLSFEFGKLMVIVSKTVLEGVPFT